jgi:hypothetical protein
MKGARLLTIFGGRSSMIAGATGVGAHLCGNTFVMRIIALFLVSCLFSFRQPVSIGAQPALIGPLPFSAGHRPAFSGEASFSCLIDGTPFSANSTDGMANAAFKTAKDIITFSLVGMDAKYKGKIPPQFNFTVAPSGTCQFKSGDTNHKYSAKYSPADYNDAYNAESGSATITSITASRIQGVFSGVFSGMGKTFKVTNGKFDLPVAKYSPPLL